MTWKAIKTLICLALSALFLTSCSHTPTATLPQNNAQFGAIVQGRTFIPPHLPYFVTTTVNAQGKIANPQDFLTQLDQIYRHSGRLSATFGHTYRKITAWVQNGANIQQLAQYDLISYQLRGDDGFQNVLMTGYFAPVIQARLTPQGEFRHPIYAMPKGKKKYTRREIYHGALRGQGLELAYSNSMLDNFLFEVQGSGFVDLGNGQLRHLAYSGKNGYAYTSIGRLLAEAGEIPKELVTKQTIRAWAARNPHRLQTLLEQNQSFVYFRHDHTAEVKGSAQVPLIALASVASDTRLVPSGNVLLVEMPLIDQQGNWTGQHQLRLMVALDRGGAVKGQHFDLYQGIGDHAGHQAGLMKHYGRVWVLQ